MAAEQGHDLAQYALGIMYFEGLGVNRDYTKALNMYQAAAEKGYMVAQIELAQMYYLGQGALKDNTYAHMWWNIASAYGSQVGQKNRNIVEKSMTDEEISYAQKLAREWMQANQ